MDDLRLILLLFGAGVILAVFVWTRFQNRPRKTTADCSDPTLRQRETDEPDEEAIAQELARMEQVMSGSESGRVTATNSERLLIISVVAPQGGVFSGDALYKSLQNNKLQFDERGIYQRVTVSAGRQEAVFGVANLVKPGAFPAEDMRGFSTPGITLFLQLPGPLDPVEAFDDFVHTTERLAVELGGELQDQKQCVITHQALMQIREGIVEDRFLRRAAS
ncbi:MAG: cell division protein ZipA C-terminal FtsZ-binding domain-containing protein [Thiogranum sp.]